MTDDIAAETAPEPQRRKRGRPSNAEIAARDAAGPGQAEQAQNAPRVETKTTTRTDEERLQARIAQLRRERMERGTVDPMQDDRLAVDAELDPNYVHFIVNDDGRNVRRFERAGWEPVREQDHLLVNEDPKNVEAFGSKAVLMRLPRVIHEEDKHREDAKRRDFFAQAQAGKTAAEEGQEYTAGTIKVLEGHSVRDDGYQP